MYYRVSYATAPFTTGSSTLGEIFSPAKDCPDIVDQIPGAEDGFYWILLPNGKKHKVSFGHNIEQWKFTRNYSTANNRFHHILDRNRSGVMFIQTAGGLHWLEWRIVLYLGQYRRMQHQLILKDLHIGQVISVMSRSWTLEFNFQLRKVLKEQRQTGKTFCHLLTRWIILWHLKRGYLSLAYFSIKKTIFWMGFQPPLAL